MEVFRIFEKLNTNKSKMRESCFYVQTSRRIQIGFQDSYRVIRSTGAFDEGNV